MTDKVSVNPQAGAVNCPTAKLRKSKKKQTAPEAPAIRAVIEPLPLPPDIQRRYSSIDALSIRRYREHHEKQAG